MSAGASELSRFARGLLLVLILLPGGTVELLPSVFGSSCTHACCRGTEACHRRSGTRATHEHGAPNGNALHFAARHVLAADCRELCGLLQVAAHPIQGASVSSASPPPPSLQPFAASAIAPRFAVRISDASPRGPPHHFSEIGI